MSPLSSPAPSKELYLFRLLKQALRRLEHHPLYAELEEIAAPLMHRLLNSTPLSKHWATQSLDQVDKIFYRSFKNACSNVYRSQKAKRVKQNTSLDELIEARGDGCLASNDELFRVPRSSLDMMAYALDDEALKLNELLDERFVGFMLKSKPIDRQLMMLCFCSALKSAEIAALLPLTEAAVNVRKSRFRKIIKTLMSH